MIIFKVLACTFLVFFSNLAYSGFYKCTINSKTIYSDKPCSTDAQTITVVNPKITPKKPSTTTSSISDKLENSRKIRNINREIESIKSEKDSKIKERNSELAALKKKKNKAANNLAGAEWETSISQEMQAITSSYDTEIKSLNSELSLLKEELRSLKKK